MSDLSNESELAQLRQRKEKLLLEQEIARLERKQTLGKAGSWSWWWVAPLAAFGTFLLIVGIDSRDGAAFIPLGLMAMVPLALKFFLRR